jgi:hypothetical protein
MSPEEYAELLAVGKVALRRDLEGNYIYDANKYTTATLPRDIVEQLVKAQANAITEHELRMKAFDRFINDLKNAG